MSHCITMPAAILEFFSKASNASRRPGELTELGFLGTEFGDGRITYLREDPTIKRKDVQPLGPVDFVFGATPRNGTIDTYSPAWYFYQFYRLLDYVRPVEDSQRPFFWMFVDNLVLEEEVSTAATNRFFETEPLIVYDMQEGEIVSAVQVWGNIPSLQSKYSAPLWTVDLAKLKQSISSRNVVGTRLAKLVKKFFVPLKEYFQCLPSEDSP